MLPLTGSPVLAKLTALAIARAVRLCEALLTLTACMLLVTGCRMKVFTFILLPVMPCTDTRMCGMCALDFSPLTLKGLGAFELAQW